MQLGIPRETAKGEQRVAMTPGVTAKLAKLGHDLIIEPGAGKAAGFADAAYVEAGATLAKSKADLYKRADTIARVRPPEPKDLARLSAEQSLISFFYPSQNEELLAAAGESGATVIAMDMVPRISRAQKMDALSSMANVAGYRAVIEAGNNFGRFFTGQVTAPVRSRRPRCW